jgi:molecular chaperone Hsp33
MVHAMDQNGTAGCDCVRRFIFENRPVRGHWVHLAEAWRDLRAHAQYPPEVTEVLGEAVAASVLLAATLKFRGTLTFQLQGNGALKLLVAQCTHDFRLRAVARCDGDVLSAVAESGRRPIFQDLAGTEGRLSVTIEAEERSLRYQGVVPLTGSSLAESLEAYFASSEQLPTRVRLVADAGCVAGMLVQKLPAAWEASGAEVGEPEEIAEAWESAREGIGQLSPADLRHRNIEELLGHGFSGHDLRLFRGAPVRFECRCSEGRVAGVLRALGPEEVRDVLREQGSVTVTCEFCQRPYRFDPVDIEALFAPSAPSGGSGAVH